MLTSNPPGDPTDDGVDRDFDLLYFNSSIFGAPTPSESQPFPDFLIDPALLASEENSPPDSQPPASTSYGTVKRPVTASTSDTTVGSGPSGTGCAAVPPTPSLVDSPLASTSSLPDPGTPPPWEWPFPQELIQPDVTLSTGDQGASSCQIPCHADINLTQGQAEMVVTPTGSSTMLASLTPIAAQPTPKPQAFFPQQIPYYPTTPLYQQTSLTPSQTQVLPQAVQPSTSSQAQVSQPHAPTLKPPGRPSAHAGPDRKATLHRAREMREALAAAVERVMFMF
ncbi:hypothetical protein A0H81_07942 [Grifola frondosa]|uniref:Uncharacterized protein n=1 Tax=Grifola frondosa TaxID=5627 RepID=A0A1C7MB83_GRIFR|nr:hypothetical protein A0H81_07942 [Grifola frondosa]